MALNKVLFYVLCQAYDALALPLYVLACQWCILCNGKVYNNINESEKIVSDQGTKTTWLEQIKETLSKNNGGLFATKDNSGISVILEWKATDILSHDLAIFKKNVVDIAAQTTAATEMQFLHAHPEAVYSEYFLRACEPFFKKGLEEVDWRQVEQTIHATIRQFYLTDISAFGDALKSLLEDVYVFVTVKNQNSQTILGFLMFSVTPAIADGNIKVIHLAVAPSEELRGLDRLLMSSIFKILPNTKRIFIVTRPTYEQGIMAYRSWDFAQDLAFVQDPSHKMNLQYFAVYEYLEDQSDLLQKTAKTLIDIK